MDSKVEALKGKGNELYQKQDYLEAITYYTSALELDPSHVISLGNRSACYLALGRNDEADADARRAISLDKSYVKGYFRLASALKNRNLFFEAAGVASLGLEIDAGNVALKKIKVECSKHTSTTKESKDGFRKKMFGELYSDKEHTSHSHDHNGCCGHHHHHHSHSHPEDADTVDATTSLNEDGLAMYKYLKTLVKRIIKGEFGTSDVSNHMLQGTFRQLVEPESFSDVLFPGVPNEVSDTLPRNLLQLMSWNSMDELIMNSLVKMSKSAAKILEGVRRKGEARGDIMDDATKVILVPQIAQETFAREVVDIVKNLSKRASNINARLNLDLASPGADDAGLDQLDPETMQVLMEGEGIAVQDAFIGNVWCGLVTADAIRYASSEKMTSTNFSNQITSIGAVQEAHLKQHNARIAWIEQKEISASYPALAEAIQNLHALPYEINAKTNTSLMLLEPCRGFTMLAHFPAGGLQPPRLDNHPGENDAGLRLTCAYHLVPYDQSLDEPRCSSRAQYILQTEKKTTQRIDIVNDSSALVNCIISTMARLASDWVEKNFKLSRHVTMMEKDFSNGYLFSEMLLQRGLIEDDVEYIVDTNMPLDVMKNFNILGRALKKLDITLTKKLVADIVSEQPGGAAELVMQIKRALEADTSRPVKSATITSVKSLRPRAFVRKSDTLQHMSPEERFLSTTLGSSDAFCDVDMIAQIDKFFTLDIIETDKYKQNEAMAAQKREEMIAARRQKMLADIAAKKKLREEIAAAGVKSHRAVQNVKKSRMIRDLQYELALETKADLIHQMKDTAAREEAMSGIESFEFNLRRNGLGGDDYSEQELVPTAESTSLFMERLERDTMKHWPTNGEISDFMMNLEKRTGDLRAARLEKARRKRRMQVDQASSSSSLEVVDEHEHEHDDGPVEPEVDTAALKQQKIDAINERVAVERAKLAEIAEEKIKEFCEEVRQRVSDEDRARLVEQVLVAREQKMLEKTKRSAKLCREILNDVVDEAIGAPAVVKVSDDAVEHSRDEILSSLVDLIRTRTEGSPDNAVSGVGTAAQILKQCGATSDLWPSIANAVLDFGSIVGTPKTGFVNNSLNITQSLLECMGKDCLDGVSMRVSAQEKETLYSMTGDAYYIVTGQQGISRAQWDKFCSWFNGDAPLVGVWDVTDALAIATALKSTYDENNAAINDYALLSKLYGIGEGLSGEVSPIAMRVLTDIIEYTTIIATSEMSENPSFSFTDTTLCILVAQTLWLRSHIARAYSAAVGSYPVARSILLSKCFGFTDATPAQIGLMEWCLRGGSRLNVAEEDTALQALLSDEQAAQKPVAGNKKSSVKSTKPKKGKVDLEGVDDSTSVKYVINFAGGAATSLEKVSDNAVVGIVLQYLKNGVAESPTDSHDIVCAQCTKINCDLLNINLSSEPKEGYRISSNAFVTMEVVLACLLQSASKLQPTPAPAAVVDDSGSNAAAAAESKDAENVVNAVAETPVVMSLQDIVVSRRELFNRSEQMLLKHWTGDNVLSICDLVSSFNGLQFARCCEVELLGSILAAVIVKLKEFDAEIAMDEAIVIEDMKTSDPRWKEFCFRYLDTLGKIESRVIVLDHERAKEQLQEYSNDLLCSMGDVIDERHRHWIQKILALHDKYKEKITSITGFVRMMAIYLGKTLQSLSGVQAVALASLGDVLKAGGYDEYPWSCSSNEDKASLTSVLQQLGDIVGVVSDDLTSAWKDSICSLESPLSDHGNFSDDLAASATFYLQFFCSVLVSLQQRNKESGEGMILKALKRNTYEHDLLKKWFHELKSTFHDSYYSELLGSSSPRRAAGSTKKTVQSAPIKFLSTYYFGVSEDSEADGVEVSSMAHGGCVEVNDMMLSMNKVKKLSAAMICASQENPIETLSSAVKNLLDSGETLPMSWRQPKKLQGFASQHVASEYIAFNQSVINALVLSHITTSPSSAYIVKLCRAILLRHSKIPFLQASSTYVKYTDVIAAIDADESLKKGWWPTAKKQRKKKSTEDMLTPAIEALAMTCVDEQKVPFNPATAMVNLDRFAVLLCLVPEFLHSTKIFNEYGGQDVQERVALNENLFHSSKCKLLSVAAELVQGGSKASFPGAKALVPEIGVTQIEWACRYMRAMQKNQSWIAVSVDDGGAVSIGSKSTFVCNVLTREKSKEK